MKIAPLSFLIISLWMFACGSSQSISNNESIVKSIEDSVLQVKSPAIIVCRPDSLTFQAHLDQGEDWIYELDSDFGFNTYMALDSFNMDGITETYTTKRYVNITNSEFNTTIDRDSIEYGIILCHPNKAPLIDTETYGYLYYIQLFETYFR